MNWNNVKKHGYPPVGVLCVIYFPVGVAAPLTEGEKSRSIGFTAAAYRRPEGWVRADRPTPVTWPVAWWAKLDLPEV